MAFSKCGVVIAILTFKYRPVNSFKTVIITIAHSKF